MKHKYYINGERGDEKMDENDEKVIKKKLRKRQLFNYTIATVIQFCLAFSGTLSYISAVIAMFNGNMDKWFSHHLEAIICLGFIAIIAAVKSLFKHEPTDDPDYQKKELA